MKSNQADSLAGDTQRMRISPIDLSIVTSLYRSAPYLEEFHRRVTDTVRRLDLSYEILLINDGSPDESLEIALELRCGDPRLGVIDLSRNFGHHKAIMTGLAHSRGRRVFLLDVDLEEDPELLPLFIQEMNRTGADVVYGVQERRKGGFLERVTGDLFYRLFDWLSEEKIPPNQLCARLITRRFVDNLVKFRDREVFLGGLFAATGYRQVGLPVHKRHKGVTSYSLARKISMAVDFITSYSRRPLVATFYIGAIVLTLSAAAATVLALRGLISGQMPPGWALALVSLYVLGGLNLFCVSIVGLYVANVFGETRRRPYAIIRQTYPAPASVDGHRNGRR